jgi:hypothetical protein
MEESEEQVVPIDTIMLDENQTDLDLNRNRICIFCFLVGVVRKLRHSVDCGEVLN